MAMIASNNANNSKDYNYQKTHDVNTAQLPQFSCTPDKDTLCKIIVRMNSTSNQSGNNKRKGWEKKTPRALEPLIIVEKKSNEP